MKCYVDAGFTELTAGWGATHFQTFEGAWPAVADGGEIDVAPGTYAVSAVLVDKSVDIVGAGAELTTFQAQGEVTSNGWWQIDSSKVLGLKSCSLVVLSNGVDAVAFSAEGMLDMHHCSLELPVGCKAIDTLVAIDAAYNYWGAGEPDFSDLLDTAVVQVEPWFKDPALSTLTYDGGYAGISGSAEVTEDITLDVLEVDLDPDASLLVSGGTLKLEGLNMGAGSELQVVDGTVVFETSAGNTEVTGTFVIYDSMGSLYIENDTEFSGDTLALISHIGIADGVQVTVSGSLVLDGCTVECSDSAGAYIWYVMPGASFKMARTEMSGFSSFSLFNSGAEVQSCTLSGTQILVAGSNNRVFHNVVTATTSLLDVGTGTVLSLDGWGNVASETEVLNHLALQWSTNSLPAGRTLTEDALYVQPGDAVDLALDLSKISIPVSGCELLLGYNGTYLTNGAIALESPWENNIYEDWSLKDGDPLFGQIDSGLGLGFSIPDLRAGLTNDGAVATVSFDAGDKEGDTVVYFRPQIDERWHTRMVSDTNGMSGTYLEPFTVNSTPVIIDGTAPVVDAFFAFQNQAGVDIDIFDATNITRSGTALIGLEASDALSGIATSSISITHRDSDALLPAILFSRAVRAQGEDLAWAIDIGNSIETGIYDVELVVADRAGNETVLAADFEVVSPNIDFQIDLQVPPTGLSTQDITYVALASDMTTELGSWTIAEEFVNGTATTRLREVPLNTAYVRVKGTKTLSRVLAVNFDNYLSASVVFGGASHLICGDLNNDNAINITEYSMISYFWNTATPIADINGDGLVNIVEYSVLQYNWLSVGE